MGFASALPILRHVFSPSRLISPELCLVTPPSCPRGRREGRVPTGTRGPPRERHTQEEPHSSIQVKPNTRPSLRDGRTAYAVLSREPNSLWPPSPQRNSPAPRRLTRSPPPQELGRSNDGQDHTVLPYARPAMFAAVFPALSTKPENLQTRRTCQRRSSARCLGAHGEQSALPRPFAPDAAASTASPARDNDDHMIAPQG